MKENSDIASQWDEVERMLSQRFGKIPNLETVLFLIGLQELGQTNKRFTKEQKEDLMHIATCTLLSQDGYYQFEKRDEDGWPHFTQIKKMPEMSVEDQELFLKEHIIRYFKTDHNLSQVDTRDS